jgi:hypothetical protein
VAHLGWERWDEMRWDEMGWERMGWDGMGGDEMRWDATWRTVSEHSLQEVHVTQFRTCSAQRATPSVGAGH